MIENTSEKVEINEKTINSISAKYRDKEAAVES